MLARPRCPGSAAPSGSLAVEAVAVVGHSQLHLRADRAQRDRHRLRLRVAAGVHHRLLGDPEQVARHLGGSAMRSMATPDLEAVAALPDGQAVLDGGVERHLLERVGAEVDDLVAQRAQVAHAQLACLADQFARLRAAARSARHCRLPTGSCRGRSAPGRGRRGSTRPRAGAPRSRPAWCAARGRERAGATPTRRSCSRPDHDGGRQRRQHEHRLVEREQVACRTVRRRAGRTPRRAQSRRSPRDREAALLALEVGVRGDQEQRGEAYRRRGSSGAASSSASSSAKSPAATNGCESLSGPRRPCPAADRTRRRSTRAPPPARGLGLGSPRSRRRRGRPSRLRAVRSRRPRSGPPTRSVSGASGGRALSRSRRAQPEGRRGRSCGVDRPVERAAVAALDEALVELVGGGVAARERGTRAGRRGRDS